MRDECIGMIEAIFNSGEDEVWPIPSNSSESPITLLGSEEGYQLECDGEAKEYEDAEGILDALIAVEEIYGRDDPLESVSINLNHLT